MKGKRHRATSQSWLPVRGVEGDHLLLRDGSLRAVLECPSLALSLKADAEQRAVMHSWSGLLTSLPYPLQFVVQTRTMRPTALPAAPPQVASDTPSAQLR